MFEAAQALGHANWFYDELQQRMQMGMNREEAIADAYPEWIRIQQICKVKPLERNFVPMLVMLQDRQITIMGLTHRQPSVGEATVQQVSSLGFDFSITAPSTNLAIIPAKTPTLYLKGILFVGDYNKKIDIFDRFLSTVQKAPKKIVFIDDKRKNVDELEALTKYGIEYIGIHYSAIEYAKPTYTRKIAEFQHRLLHEIISNETALFLMENGNATSAP